MGKRWLGRKVQAERDALIVRLKRQGLTHKQIAAQDGLAIGGVNGVLARRRRRELALVEAKSVSC